MGEKRQGRARLIIGRKDMRQCRKCMCCGEPFTSFGRFNRLCSGCKGQGADFTALGFDRRR